MELKQYRLLKLDYEWILKYLRLENSSDIVNPQVIHLTLF
jgi:hypothetical protein